MLRLRAETALPLMVKQRRRNTVRSVLRILLLTASVALSGYAAAGDNYQEHITNVTFVGDAILIQLDSGPTWPL